MYGYYIVCIIDRKGSNSKANNRSKNRAERWQIKLAVSRRWDQGSKTWLFCILHRNRSGLQNHTGNIRGGWKMWFSRDKFSLSFRSYVYHRQAISLRGDIASQVSFFFSFFFFLRIKNWKLYNWFDLSCVYRSFFFLPFFLFSSMSSKALWKSPNRD